MSPLLGNRMALFPVQRPKIGLGFTGHTLTAVEVGAPWWPSSQLRVRSLKRQELPAGLVRSSTDEANISDVAALAGELRALVGRRRCVPASISLPNRCAHVALFDFDVVPKHPNECESIVRWRFQQDMNLSTGDCRVSFRIFHSLEKKTGSEMTDASPVRVLAAAVRHNVLAQYEQVCEDAGLLLVSVGIQGLQLFDLCRTEMEGSREFFFSSCLDDHLFFVAIRNGCPIFLRNKPLRRAEVELENELAGTIQFYDEYCALASLDTTRECRPLVLVDPYRPCPTEKAAAREVAHMPIVSREWMAESLQVDVRRLMKESLSVIWPDSETSWLSGLPAVASLACR